MPIELTEEHVSKKFLIDTYDKNFGAFYKDKAQSRLKSR